MDNLKKLTMEHHRDAERQAFAKELMSGEIHPQKYAAYLFHQHACYKVLETMAGLHGLLDDMPGLERADRIWEDYLELSAGRKELPAPLLSVLDYLEQLQSISTDPEKLMAHIYVRHMGDLFGGQMIKSKVPGAGTYYEFDAPINELKAKVREKLNDDMADEAQLCFAFATRLFQDMMTEEQNEYVERTDSLPE
jgi:heme oxygenase|tara:strand:- start:9480 stop:10061 length:582 start_codon:yes stop_codon:yes gene_type:complete